MKIILIYFIRATFIFEIFIFVLTLVLVLRRLYAFQRVVNDYHNQYFSDFIMNTD